MANGKTQATNRILWLVQLALLTAITIVLQLLASSVKVGPFQLALVLVPIVVGAAMLGLGAGAWLGAVFGAVVLLNGDAAPFLAVTVPGTIATVLVKGVGAGLATGAVYRLLAKKNITLAVLAAAAAAPVANTGIFALACYAFFLPTLREWAGGGNVTSYIFITMIGVNFVVEFLSNVLLSSAIVRILKLRKK